MRTYIDLKLSMFMFVPGMQNSILVIIIDAQNATKDSQMNISFDQY